MGGKRQKNQLLLAFMAEGRDEFPMAAVEGTEPPVAKRELRKPDANGFVDGGGMPAR